MKNNPCMHMNPCFRGHLMYSVPKRWSHFALLLVYSDIALRAHKSPKAFQKLYGL